MALYTNIKGPINYTVVGSPTIENGIASGFTHSSYVNISLIESSKYVESFEFFIKFTTPNEFRTTTWQGLIGFNSSSTIDGSIAYDPGLYITTAGKLYFNGPNTVSNLPSLLVNTTYYVKYKYINNIATIDISTDNINFNHYENLSPNPGSFYFRKNIIRIGDAIVSQDRHFDGSIDLNETYININGNAWFGTSFSKVKLHSPTAIAYTVKGNPTITEDGVASGFTDKTDYLTLGAFNPGTSKWKFTTKVKIYDYATQISLIDRNSSTRCFQIVVRTTGKFRVNISTNGSSKANEVDGTHVLSVNTIYYICFEYDGSKYYLKYSLDNINWTTDITINNSTKIYPVSSMCMGHSWYNSGTEKWNGEIYLRYTRFEINGVTNDKYKLHALEGDYAIVDDKLVWANPNIYLHSDGNQYIDTGIKPQDDLEFNINFMYLSQLTGYNNIMGCRTGTGTNSKDQISFTRSQSFNECYVGWGKKEYKFGSYTAMTNNTKYNCDFSRANLILNNTIVATSSNYAGDFATSNLTIYLFGRSQNGSLGNPSNSNIYNFKCKENNTILQYLVPVPQGLVIGSYTVPSNGMFDIVNQQFYPNQGTGTFTYGKDK